MTLCNIYVYNINQNRFYGGGGKFDGWTSPPPCNMFNESNLSAYDPMHSMHSMRIDNSSHLSTIQIYGINGQQQIPKQFINLPSAGRSPHADGQINVYLYVRTLIQELSQNNLRAESSVHTLTFIIIFVISI
ncbi:MAG: hypothetical protein EZS28_015521 [Streblomastix strix]|uniref:Uncharacterized protein n=1 Tax=Streblomastix strix TaxID=222440 RepID=A0A5J4W213_9EUKA|nr:MAG: hypothetical protein EZS28_015521 [Streblomastix strix]